MYAAFIDGEISAQDKSCLEAGPPPYDFGEKLVREGRISEEDFQTNWQRFRAQN
jgi:hypothetical protein